MQELNRAYQGYAATDQRIVYLDLGTTMLTGAGEPDSDIFVSDGLHMNAKGYALWRRSVADPVVALERSFEPTP
jgi:lysophospholipase L1-like esterase